MTAVRPGMPGHDDGTAFVRPRREELAEGLPDARPCREACAHVPRKVTPVPLG
jgi:hypothetical protein